MYSLTHPAHNEIEWRVTWCKSGEMELRWLDPETCASITKVQWFDKQLIDVNTHFDEALIDLGSSFFFFFALIPKVL